MKLNLLFVASLVLTSSLQNNFASDSDLSKLADANNTFALKLMKQLAAEQPGASIFVSPYSAATALQLAATGATGQTKSEMQEVLGTINLTAGELDQAIKAANVLLNPANTNVILTTANALWYRQGAAVKPTFLAASREIFSSTVRAVDFSNAPSAEAEINQWASDQTHGHITGIADGMITPDTDLILANAIYFKGRWLDPFDKELTKERPFHSADGTTKNLPMMHMSNQFFYRKGSGYQTVVLPYMGHDLAMYIFLPDPDSSPAKLLEAMNGDDLHRLAMPNFNPQQGLVALPKFKLKDTLELKQPLKALRMKSAFNPMDADFSAMFAGPHFISKIRQKTFVEVNEEGAEAAAVTMLAEANGLEINAPKPFEMIVDRPFLFAIVEPWSGMILFMGVVNQL